MLMVEKLYHDRELSSNDALLLSRQFQEEGVRTFDDLRALTDEHLKAMGLTDKPRTKLLSTIATADPSQFGMEWLRLWLACAL